MARSASARRCRPGGLGWIRPPREDLESSERLVLLRHIDVISSYNVRRASVLPFQKCVNSVSGFANSVFYRFRFGKFRFFTVSDIKNSVSFFSSRIFVVNNFCFQHSFSFSILIKKFYSVTVLR